ncbi:hypothetical protein [Nocardia anaemiae]|nr:hypothetical protein [Nocardia anaemiae]
MPFTGISCAFHGVSALLTTPKTLAVERFGGEKAEADRAIARSAS